MFSFWKLLITTIMAAVVLLNAPSTLEAADIQTGKVKKAAKENKNVIYVHVGGIT